MRRFIRNKREIQPSCFTMPVSFAETPTALPTHALQSTPRQVITVIAFPPLVFPFRAKSLYSNIRETLSRLSVSAVCVGPETQPSKRSSIFN